VVVSVRDASTNEFVGCKVVATSVNTVTLTFSSAPAANSLKVAVIG
jgi:uroporphyrinogen-III synthase